MHDPDATELFHLIPQVFAHSPDLPIQALRQNDAELVGAHLFDETRLRDGPQHRNALAHVRYERLVQRLINRDHIFLFVVVLRAQNLVDDISIARQKNQAVAVLVQSTDRENSFLVVDELNNRVFLAFRVLGGHDPDRFVESDVDVFGLRLSNSSAIGFDFIVRTDLGAQPGFLTVDRDPSLAQQIVRFTPRTKPGLAQVFVDSNTCPVRSFAFGIGRPSLFRF